MGFWNQLMNCVNGTTRKLSLLVVGLDNSGKTTILRKLKPKQVDLSEVVPTVGAGDEQFYQNKIQFNCYDMSG
jgi:ADP-ribosylation factor-like protein 6